MPRSCRPVAVVEPFAGDRGGQDRPVGLGVDPGADLVAHRALAQVEVLGLADLQIGRARDRRARVHQIGRVELFGAVLALVAARALVAAIGTGAFDVAVGQKAAVGLGIDLLLRHLLDQARLGQPSRQMLRERMVAPRRRASEMVEAEPEPVGDVLLHFPHPRAVFRHGLAGLGGGEFGRRSMLVGGADEQHLVTAGARVAGVDVGRKLRSHQIAQMLDAVDVGQGGGDQDA